MSFWLATGIPPGRDEQGIKKRGKMAGEKKGAGRAAYKIMEFFPYF
jgi:hypothetical protein